MPQMWVPRSCQADVENLEAVTGLGEPLKYNVRSDEARPPYTRRS